MCLSVSLSSGRPLPVAAFSRDDDDYEDGSISLSLSNALAQHLPEAFPLMALQIYHHHHHRADHGADAKYLAAAERAALLEAANRHQVNADLTWICSTHTHTHTQMETLKCERHQFRLMMIFMSRLDDDDEERRQQQRAGSRCPMSIKGMP